MNLLENQEQMQIFGCWFLHLYIAPEEIYKKRLKKSRLLIIRWKQGTIFQFHVDRSLLYKCISSNILSVHLH